MHIEVLDAHAPGRRAAEDFIRRHYAGAYGADVLNFLPRLLVLRNQQAPLAALGFRRARGESLYLEHYLDAAVESLVASKVGHAVPRHALVEVGSLAASLRGGARWLIAALTAYLKGAGYEWAVFTAVKPLRNSFERLGVELVSLAPADPSRLAQAERYRWGSYYEADPCVVAANVHQSFSALYGVDDDGVALAPMWRAVYAAGAVPERGAHERG